MTFYHPKLLSNTQIGRSIKAIKTAVVLTCGIDIFSMKRLRYQRGNRKLSVDEQLLLFSQ